MLQSVQTIDGGRASIVVGQSVGGLTAMAVAARAPQGLKAAIISSGMTEAAPM